MSVLGTYVRALEFSTTDVARSIGLVADQIVLTRTNTLHDILHDCKFRVNKKVCHAGRSASHTLFSLQWPHPSLHHVCSATSNDRAQALADDNAMSFSSKQKSSSSSVLCQLDGDHLPNYYSWFLHRPHDLRTRDSVIGI